MRAKEKLSAWSESVGGPDVTVGLFYYRLRYYDPVAGRFVSRDPLGLWGDPAQRGNGQSYCGNNPVNLVDPLGLDGCICGNCGNCETGEAGALHPDTAKGLHEGGIYGALDAHNRRLLKEEQEKKEKSNPFVDLVPYEPSVEHFDLNAQDAQWQALKCLAGDAIGAVLGIFLQTRLGPSGTKSVFATKAANAERTIAKCPKTGKPLGDLSPDEVLKIQQEVNRAGCELYVTGSAAKGTRVNPGADLPLGTKPPGGKRPPGTKSDIDYFTSSPNRKKFKSAGSEGRLPDIDKEGITPGVNPEKYGPSIRFQPNQPPEIVPGQP